jgi:hypothetical protein
MDKALEKWEQIPEKIHEVFEETHFHKEKENTTNIMQHKKQ